MSDTEATPAGIDVPDVRIYLTDATDWEARVKQGADKVYCYQKNPGEDFFHLIVNGEIYLTRPEEKLCLRCALRQRIVTTDRLHWQHLVRREKPSPL